MSLFQYCIQGYEKATEFMYNSYQAISQNIKKVYDVAHHAYDLFVTKFSTSFVENVKKVDELAHKVLDTFFAEDSSSLIKNFKKVDKLAHQAHEALSSGDIFEMNAVAMKIGKTYNSLISTENQSDTKEVSLNGAMSNDVFTG